MDKKELNFLIDISKKLSGSSTTKKEVEEISKYLNQHFNTITIELVNERSSIDVEEEIDNKNKYKKHGKGYKKKHRKRVKKKKYKSKKWNRY